MRIVIFSPVDEDGVMFFDIEKLIGFAAYVMKKMGLSSIQYIMLIKLMYLSDRKSVELYDHTISNDNFVSMDKGPVLSRLLNLIHDECASELQNTWDTYFKTCEHYVKIVSDEAIKKVENLSRAEMKVIDEVVSEFGKRDVWELIDNHMHTLPEWKNPNGSSIPIKLEDIMRALNKSEDEIKSTLEENEEYRKEAERCRRILA